MLAGLTEGAACERRLGADGGGAASGKVKVKVRVKGPWARCGRSQSLASTMMQGPATTTPPRASAAATTAASKLPG